MLHVNILNQNYGEDFNGLLILIKKLIVDIYTRNKPEFIGLKGSAKYNIVNQAINEYDGISPLSILNEEDILTIRKRINYQITMANDLICNKKDDKLETRYYILKDEDSVVAFQQAQIMSAGEQIVGSRYLAYTDEKYARFGKQHILDSANTVKYDICSEVLYYDISNWFESRGVTHEKTSTGKRMLPNISAYIILKGFLPQSKDKRNIYFEKDLSQTVEKEVRKKIYKTYLNNLSRTTPKKIEMIIQEVQNISEFNNLSPNQKKGIIRCILIDQDDLSNSPNEKIDKLNERIQKNIDALDTHANYTQLYKLARANLSTVSSDDIDYCLETLIQLELTNIKRKNGQIVSTDLRDLQQKYNLFNKQFSCILSKISSCTRNIDESAHCMLEQLNKVNCAKKDDSNTPEH